MNESVRQTLKELIAKHGPGLCGDARRCEALLRDYCGDYRREINILVSAVEERVPLDLLAGKSAMPPGLLLSRLTKRLEDHLALTQAAARWAVETWALALAVVTEFQLEELKERAPASESTGLHTEVAPKIERAQTPPLVESPKPAPPPKVQPQKIQPPTQTKPRPSPPTINHPPLAPPALSPRVAGGPVTIPRPTSAVKSPPPSPTNSPNTRRPSSPEPFGRTRRGFRSCLTGCLLLVLLLLAVFVGAPYVISFLRQEQQQSQPEFQPPAH